MSGPGLARAARRAAQAFRLGMEASAGQTIQGLVEGLLSELERRPDLATRVQAALSALVAAQVRRDPIGAADVLEHELAALLER